MASHFETTSGNWKYFLVALAISLVLWYMINAREQVDRLVEVQLDYKGVPAGFVVTSGQINKISVRLRGPLELLRSLSNRDLSHTMDLSGLTKGTNIIPLTWDPVQTVRPLQVLEIIPQRLTLIVDEVIERHVPVIPKLQASNLDRSVRMLDLKVDPGEVLVRGPSSVILPLKNVTAEVPTDPEVEDKLISDDIKLLGPAGVEIVPDSSQVQRRLLIDRRNVSIQREIVNYDDSLYTIQPARVSLVVAVPRTLVNNQDFLETVQAYVRHRNVQNQGERTVEFVTPPSVRIVAVHPATVKLVPRQNKKKEKASEKE